MISNTWKTDRRRLGIGAALAALLTCAMVPSARAQSNEIDTALLPPTPAELISVEALGVCDCPADLDASQPSRAVLQYIEGSLYKWREYDVAGGQTCVRLVLPEERVLTVAEAQGLLTASAQWAVQAVAADPEKATVLDASDPILNLPGVDLRLPPGYVSSETTATGPDIGLSSSEMGAGVGGGPAPQTEMTIETVCGTDDRTRVTSFASTQSYPWNTIGYVSNSYTGGGAFRGTAFLVTPCVVLTNGHMVYDQGLGQWAATWNFSPGQYESPINTVQRPYGTAASTALNTNTGWINVQGPEYDYASAFLDTNFSGSITTYMPLVFNYTPPSVNRAGYGAVVGGLSTQDQWHSYDAAPTVSGRMLQYMMDTSGGSSGSPVWEMVGGIRTVNTIHGYGGCPNSGPRLVTQNETLITTWMQHACPGGGAPAITWVTGPAAAAAGGDPIPLTWNLANFTGPIAENQAHFGITSVLGSSPVQPGSNGNHSWTATAPNVGTFDSPTTYGFICRALDNGTQVLGPPASCNISAGQFPPTVTWVTPPPASASSGQSINVSWQLSNYVASATTNEFAFGITTILGQACNQPGGNGTYSCAWPVPPLTGSGTVFFTAYAQNAVEFAFAPPVGVLLSP